MTENHPSSRPAMPGQTVAAGRAPTAGPGAGPRPGVVASAVLGSGKSAIPEPSRIPNAPPLTPPAPAGLSNENGIDSSTAVDLLRRIHDQLERANRRSRQHDFSVLRLFGALLQMFAIVVALWGLLALTGDHHDPALARFSLACFLQLASVAAFTHDYLR